jgi:hypothetical protein
MTLRCDRGDERRTELVPLVVVVVDSVTDDDDDDDDAAETFAVDNVADFEDELLALERCDGDGDGDGAEGSGSARVAYAAATGAAVSESSGTGVRVAAVVATLVDVRPCDVVRGNAVASATLDGDVDDDDGVLLSAPARVELENGVLPCDATRCNVEEE